MLIAIEGMDGNFKSTVAEKLSKALGFDVVKGSSFELATSPNDVLFAHFIELALRDDIIIDRFVWSNRCYAQIFSDYSLTLPEQQEIIEELFNEQQGLLIYLHSDVETLANRINQRGDNYITTDHLQSINEKYEEVLRDSNVRKMRFNTKDFSSDDITRLVLELVNSDGA